MATIITKYSDYAINSIEFFINKIETELRYRDLKGLTHNVIELISVTKQHPLATLMASQLQEGRNLDELRASVIPAISVTPGNPTDEGLTLGQTYTPEVVDSDFIDLLKAFYAKTDKEIQQDVLITKDQIDLIIAAYKKNEAGGVRSQTNQWRKNEEINISVWTNAPDQDIMLGRILESLMSSLQVGFAGEDSGVRNFKYTVAKGLTNFNFNRVLFGSEYNLTFMNTYNNFTIYSDDVITDHDVDFTYEAPGDE